MVRPLSICQLEVNVCILIAIITAQDTGAQAAHNNHHCSVCEGDLVSALLPLDTDTPQPDTNQSPFILQTLTPAHTPTWDC